MCSTDVFLVILAVLFPPLPVWVKSGLCSADSIINILLCLLGYFPGLLHSWYIVAKYPDPPYEYESLAHHDREAGRVTYVYFQSQPPPSPQHNGLNYGTAQRSPQPHPQSRPQQQQQQQHYQEAGVEDHGEGRSNAPPPSYAQAIAGDHKIQTQD